MTPGIAQTQGFCVKNIVPQGYFLACCRVLQLIIDLLAPSKMSLSSGCRKVWNKVHKKLLMLARTGGNFCKVHSCLRVVIRSLWRSFSYLNHLYLFLPHRAEQNTSLSLPMVLSGIVSFLRSMFGIQH